LCDIRVREQGFEMLSLLSQSLHKICLGKFAQESSFFHQICFMMGERDIMRDFPREGEGMERDGDGGGNLS
jgi:hypothetical protein